MAGQEPPRHAAFHPDVRVVDEHGIEIFFGIITRQAIRRGVFHSVTELQAAITRFIDAWNDYDNALRRVILRDVQEGTDSHEPWSTLKGLRQKKILWTKPTITRVVAILQLAT